MTALAVVLAASDFDRITPLQFLGVLAIGVGFLATGWLYWSGRVGRDVRYQTFYGAWAAGFPGGLGICIVAVGLGLRDGLGKPEDWWLWWVLSIVGFSLMMIGTLYILVYFWFGVPDALRPRPQRGQPKPSPVLLRRRR